VPSTPIRLRDAHLLRVPRIIPIFWVIKALSTAAGESTSDYLVHAISPVGAVGIGFLAFLGALAIQFSRHRYVAWAYWLAVCMVGVFGTMAADVLHVGFHVPYVASSALYAICLAAVFVVWERTEHTLSIHTIDTPRREAFYWAAVVATFATGTAVGDLSATTLHLGYGHSALLFIGLMAIPVLGYVAFGLNGVGAFWIAYVLTRPIGASFSDWIGKSHAVGGLGVGDGTVALIFFAAIVVLVAYLSVSKIDVQSTPVVEKS